MKKFLIIMIMLAMLGGFYLLTKNNSGEPPVLQSQQTPRVVNGQQIIDLRAKGGYWPRTINAQANIPTTLQVTTSGTFDCSAAFTIPSMNYRTNLPPSGMTSVEIPPQQKGSTLRGTCAMGMYSFAINFN
jgi:plastocyanin domain-containing protein